MYNIPKDVKDTLEHMIKELPATDRRLNARIDYEKLKALEIISAQLESKKPRKRRKKDGEEVPVGRTHVS